MLRRTLLAGFALSLAGCSGQYVRDQPDGFNPYSGAAWIFNAGDLTEAQAKADMFCAGRFKGRAHHVPEYHRDAIAKQQKQRRDGVRVLEPIGWEFRCSESAALRSRAEYGDPASIKYLEDQRKQQRDEAERKSAEHYQLLRKLAKQNKVESYSRVLPDGTIISETYGNGRLCTGVSDEFGSQMSCEEVK